MFTHSTVDGGIRMFRYERHWGHDSVAECDCGSIFDDDYSYRVIAEVDSRAD